MTDRFNIQSQMEHLQLKYVGTGHADTNKTEWFQNQHRDSYCSYIGHPSLLNYFSIASNQSQGRMKYQFLQRLPRPCVPVAAPANQQSAQVNNNADNEDMPQASHAQQ